MESVLVAVTMVSLALAVGMSVVAWRLLRVEKERALATVEALQAGALDVPGPRGDATAAAPGTPEPARQLARAVEAMPASLPNANGEAPAAWDGVLRSGGRSAESIPVATRSAETGLPIVADGMAMFAGGDERPAPSRRWLALGAVAVVMAAGVATAYAVRGWNGATLFASEPATSSGIGTPALELVSLRHTVSESGAFSVTGLVANPSTGRAMAGVAAVVYLFDAEGRFLASGRAPLEVGTFHPGDESPFILGVPGVTGVSRYRVGFRFADGAVVAHVDRRAQGPAGTFEQAVTPDPAPPVATPVLPGRRSEGE
jgi:hypothetical protein